VPIYEYQPTGEACCDHCREGFEILQGFDDAHLTACPECGNPVQRIVSAPNVIGRPLDPLSPSNLAAKGFTQYKKDKDGLYRKTAGAGPETIKKPKPPEE